MAKTFGKKIKLASVFTAVLLLVVLFTALGTLIPAAQNAAAEMDAEPRCTEEGGVYNDTTLVCQVNATTTTALSYSATPFVTFFGRSGLLILAIMAATVMVVLGSIGLIKSKKGR